MKKFLSIMSVIVSVTLPTLAQETNKPVLNYICKTDGASLTFKTNQGEKGTRAEGVLFYNVEYYGPNTHKQFFGTLIANEQSYFYTRYAFSLSDGKENVGQLELSKHRCVGRGGCSDLRYVAVNAKLEAYGTESFYSCEPN